MSLQLVVSDAIHRRISTFSSERYAAFQLAAADISKGRVAGQKVHTSPITKRNIFVLKRPPYSMYYSVDPTMPESMVIEEFLTEGEEDLVLDLFAEGPD